MTQTQQSILDVVFQTEGHVTAEQVLALVRQIHPSVSLSTVYRNLDIFAQTGRLRRIKRAGGADYYDKTLAPHDHAYCVKCSKISDFTIAELASFLSGRFDHPILSFELLINYVCPDCRSV